MSYDRYAKIPAPDDKWHIEVLGFSGRVHNTLLRHDIRTVGDLIACDEQDLTDLRNFGLGSLAEVLNTLAKHGLKLTEVAR